MPTSHSKRNTALAFFTAHERSLLKTAWGTQSARLSRDSFLPFSSCQLCLLISRDPVACVEGDVFCRECAISNLLAQRKEIQRLEKDGLRKEELEREKREIEEEEEHERSVRNFERVQMGLEARGTKRAQAGDSDVAEERRAKKEKFALDAEEILQVASEERKKIRDELDAEKKAAKKHLPSFWVPSETPDKEKAGKGQEKAPKLQPLCPCSKEDKPHSFSLKTLTAINFTIDKDDKTSEKRSCPSCRKSLSNSTKAVLAVPCGHVLCKPCADKFLKATIVDPHNPDDQGGVLQCYVCEADLTERNTKKDGDGGKKKKKKDKEGIKPGLVELRSDGTGFAGGGNAQVQKKGVVFQC